MSINVHYATFGNKDGSHQLLESTLPVSTPALKALRFLVDRPAGHIDSSVTWSPYWGCQAVGDWWAIWRGEEDSSAPRKNMVRAKVALVPLIECGCLSDLSSVLSSIGPSDESVGVEFAGTVVEQLATAGSPIFIPNLAIAPGLLSTLWPRLWASARRELSLRTVFEVESLNVNTLPKIVLFPSVLLARWRGITVISQPDACLSPTGLWFSGEAAPQLQSLIEENAEHLPGDFSVLSRLNRLVEKLDILYSGRGTLEDALFVIRTQASFSGGFCLPPKDTEIVGALLLKLADSNADEIRTASLTRLDYIPNRDLVKSAVARWVEVHIAEAKEQDALWILEHHLSESHSDWWKEGIKEGLAAAIDGATQALASSVWRWLEIQPQSLRWLENYFNSNRQCEVWLAADAPALSSGVLLNEIRRLCSVNNWPTLLGTVLRGWPLVDVVGVLRDATTTPELGLEALVAERSLSELVIASATTGWTPLLDRAVDATLAQPHLFMGVDDKPAIFDLLNRHLALGGRFPEKLITVDFVTRVFDRLLDGDPTAAAIVAMLPARAGSIALVHKNASTLLARLNEDLQAGAAEAWWTHFITDESASAPPAPIHRLVVRAVQERLNNASIVLMLRLLEVLPSIDEVSFIKWMEDTGFLWEEGDHRRLALVLESRQWASAATRCRWSWKRELNIVAWHARSLLSWSDRFWWPPSGAGSSSIGTTFNYTSNSMRITFLAANPLGSEKLALDEEARSIEAMIRAAKHRDQIIFHTRWAVRPEDLQQVLLEDEPVVVHFSGHGAGKDGIVLHSQDQGAYNLVSEDALVDLFRVLKDDIRVVVLNACYSEVQAQAIVREIDFVVGMSDSVSDAAAREFAAAFYNGLAFGRSVQTAFELGVNKLRLLGFNDEKDIPKLLVRPEMDANSTILVGPT